jgi:hypothetical protein
VIKNKLTLSNSFMETEKTHFNLKPLVAILLLLLGGSGYYIYQLKNTEKKLKTDIEIVTLDKQKALDSLSMLKTTYDKALADKELVTQDLLAEREKVVNLIEELNRSKGDLKAMKIFKIKYEKLQQNFKTMIDEDSGLKKINEMLVRQRDSTALIVDTQKKSMDTMATINSDLKRKVEAASKLVITNIKTQAIRVKKSGEVETDKARKADKLKVCFTIAANEIADSGEKSYYVQIIDANNNVLGQKKTDYFGSKMIEYSFISKVKFKNQSVDVCDYLEAKEGVEFVKGQYFVNLFDKENLVSKTSFTLK